MPSIVSPSYQNHDYYTVCNRLNGEMQLIAAFCAINKHAQRQKVRWRWQRGSRGSAATKHNTNTPRFNSSGNSLSEHAPFTARGQKP